MAELEAQRHEPCNWETVGDVKSKRVERERERERGGEEEREKEEGMIDGSFIQVDSATPQGRAESGSVLLRWLGAFKTQLIPSNRPHENELDDHQLHSDHVVQNGYSSLLSFTVTDINNTVTKLMGLGAELDGPIKYEIHGKVAAMRCIDGHMLGLCEPA
ncbi:hypothetical protein L1049_014151 [Liquidambar formosana]|uniref:Uncharacterized protein n=1 Tax=Liquidambar formosana TaxID=63359 RepID=A0AAP0RQF2_LIQFO